MASPRLKPKDAEELLTVADVAELLKVSAVTVRRLLASGALAKTNVRRSVRVKASDYVRYVEGL